MNLDSIKRYIVIILVFGFIICSFSVFISINYIGSIDAENTNFGANNLEVTEHRITVLQEEGSNLITVQDEFWIINKDNKPYYGFISNWLPNDISTEHGMFCQISEKGDHTCYPWNAVNNYYYWSGNFVILPDNYATNFNLEIITNILNNDTNDTNSKTITHEIDTASKEINKLIEPDPWAWVREGFYHGWNLVFNFSLKNKYNESMTFEINNQNLPPGVKIELYFDSDNNTILSDNDTLISFDRDFDGKWDASPYYDSNGNNIPDIQLPGNNSETFFVYVRADYMLHFLSKYNQDFRPEAGGSVDFIKETIYDTDMLRIFIVPNSDTNLNNNEISFQERHSEGNMFYYGEWKGAKETELKIHLTSETEDKDEKFDQYIIGMVIIFSIILIAIIIARVNKKKHQQKEAQRIKRTVKVKQTKKPGSIRKKAGEQNKKQKRSKALKRLEEDYEAGMIDKEIYEELKEKYSNH